MPRLRRTRKRVPRQLKFFDKAEPGETVQVDVKVANTGARAGEMVVPVYVGRPVSGVLAPPKRLVAYTRVALEPGQTRTVSLAFPLSRLAVTPGDVVANGTSQVEPGGYRLFAGDQQADFTVR